MYNELTSEVAERRLKARWQEMARQDPSLSATVPEWLYVRVNKKAVMRNGSLATYDKE